MLPILARTSNHVKSLFLLARVRGLPQRIDVHPLLIEGFLLPGTREKQGRGWVFPHLPFSFAQEC
jgi:hypothetical protein